MSDGGYLKRPRDAESQCRLREAAVRCLPEYQEAWRALEERHGPAALREGLEELRRTGPMPSSFSPAAEDLRELSRSFFMERGPVDPDRDDDFGTWGPSPSGEAKAVRVMHQPDNPGPWLHLMIDLSAPKRTVAAQLQELRVAYRVTAARVKRQRSWENDTGWGTAFALLREKTVTNRSGAALGRDRIGGVNDEEEKANRANKLLRAASEVLEEVREEIEQLRAALGRGEGLTPEQKAMLLDPEFHRAAVRLSQAGGPWL